MPKRSVILRSSVWSTCRFWRKSHKNASFLNFQTSFLEEKPCRNASFLSFKASLLQEVSQKRFVFWVSEFHFWTKSRRNASFLSFKASFLDFQIHWSNWMICQSIQSHSEWLSNQLNLKAAESGICLWNHLNLTSLESQALLESQITWTLQSQINDWHSNHLKRQSIDKYWHWQPNRLTPQSIDNRSAWISNRLNRKVVESHISWSSNELTTKTLEPQIGGISKQLNLKPLESQVHWISNQMTCKTTESEINCFPANWIPHLLPIGSLSLETSATASCGRYFIEAPSKSIVWAKYLF